MSATPAGVIAVNTKEWSILQPGETLTVGAPVGASGAWDRLVHVRIKVDKGCDGPAVVSQVLWMVPGGPAFEDRTLNPGDELSWGFHDAEWPAGGAITAANPGTGSDPETCVRIQVEGFRSATT